MYLQLEMSRSTSKKWTTFQHNGVMFPPEYVKHNIPIIYKGEQIILDIAAEEYATLYAKYIETDYVKSKVFNKNFWHDWKAVLGKDHKIKSLEDCDFGLIYNYILKTKEEKLISKEQRKQNDEKYMYAMIDGKKQPVGNFRIEPPGIFLGRGCNPNLGMIKRRIYPEDITINIDKHSPIPEIPTFLHGHKWGKIIHDNTVEWLAAWKDNITGKIKYVWLASHSDMKIQSDIEKFELARKLKKKIKKIRETNEGNMKSSDEYVRQMATALYLIDSLALRVGNEKGSDETDTVGVTSLRVEHVKLENNNTVTLDFLGKDSVRYYKTTQVSDIVYKNLQDFVTGKANDEKIFDQVTSNDINNYLQTFMKDLTAKVFRTFNASNLFQKELTKLNKKYETIKKENNLEKIILDDFNIANAKVALLCNHQKNISSSFSDQMKKLKDSIRKAKANIKKTRSPEKKLQLEKKLELLKSKKNLKMEIKTLSLSTSKVNYIDPRIAYAFIKKHKIPLDKVFTKTLQEKFAWAKDVEEDFIF